MSDCASLFTVDIHLTASLVLSLCHVATPTTNPFSQLLTSRDSKPYHSLITSFWLRWLLAEGDDVVGELLTEANRPVVQNGKD